MANILLINPISGRGHLDAYARLYARAFLELGHHVSLVAATDGGVPDYLVRQFGPTEFSFRFTSFDEGERQRSLGLSRNHAGAADAADTHHDAPEPVRASHRAAVSTCNLAGGIAREPECYPPLLQRIRRVWASEGIPGLSVRVIRAGRRTMVRVLPVRMLRAGASRIGRASKSGRQAVRRASSHAARVVLRTVVVDAAQPGRPGGRFRAKLRNAVARRLLQYPLFRRLRDSFGTAASEPGRLRFEPMVRAAQGAVLLSAGSSPDLVCFLYMDMMAELPPTIAVLDEPGAWPWIGVVFHPRLAGSSDAGIEGYFESRRARGAIFLVPHAVPVYQAARPDLHFGLVPDVADLERPERPHPIAEEMRRQADGRIIVLQAGTIAPHKGIVTLLDVIARADPARFFFAMIGEAHWESFGAHEASLRAFYADPPENVLVHASYIGDERDYNSVIATCDVLYAVYQDFNSSSNVLGKASGLRRRVLVAGDSLMGQRVLASRIGGVAPQGDPDGILQALSRLHQAPEESFDFDHYSELHSLEALKKALADALPHWCDAAAPGAVDPARR